MAAHRSVVILGGAQRAVTAFYLAKNGHRPLVLERRNIVGGAAVTEEFHPGFKCSTVAHAGGPPLGNIVQDMQLARHGLQKLESPVVFLLRTVTPAGSRFIATRKFPQKRFGSFRRKMRRSTSNFRKASRAWPESPRNCWN